MAGRNCKRSRRDNAAMGLRTLTAAGSNCIKWDWEMQQSKIESLMYERKLRVEEISG